MQNTDISSLADARQFGLGVLLGVWAAIDHNGGADEFTRRAVAAAMAANSSGDPDAGLRFAVRHYRRLAIGKPRNTLPSRAVQLARFLPEGDQ